ncbi:MAG: hypothetical protein ABSF66_03445 [Terriglobales bacterium]|jgi:hypothetical protein
MAFYSKPNDLLSPGDVFPELPIGPISHPLKILRKSDYNPKPSRGPQDLRRAFAFPQEENLLSKNAQIRAKEGEAVVASARLCKAMVLTWGSQIEEDMRNYERSGRAHGKVWLTTPLFPLVQIPENETTEDAETGEKISVRQVIIENRSHLYMYLPPFPETAEQLGHYLDFRKMVTLPIQYFLDSKGNRIVTLHEDGLNLLYSRLMWFFTRVEYFYHPIVCQKCGADVEMDLRFEGQNIDAEPWQ